MLRIRSFALLAAAALALAAAPALAADSGELGPLCAGLAQQMGLSPDLVKGFIDSQPLIPSEGFCPWLTQNLTETQACDLLTLVQFGLTGGGNLQPPECPQNGTLAYQEAPAGNLTRLADRRPVPAQFGDAQALLQEEGASYYWLYQMTENTLAYARCSADTSLEEGLLLPPGWEVEVLANLSQAGGSLPSLPMAFLLRNAEANQLVVIVRSTLSTSEWVQDFQTNQTTDSDVAKLFGEDAQIAYGFGSVFDEVWPGIEAALDELVVGAEPGSTPEVWVSGHSMGAAVGNLVAYAAQQHLNQKMGEEKAPVINAVFFAPPQVGGPAFTERGAKLVNSRGVTFTDDIVQQFPCDPEMPACPSKPSGILGTLGVTGIATNQDNATSWEYQTTHGVVSFSAKDMPQDASTWARINSVPLCWATVYLRAAHSCSYMCLLSSFSPEPVAQNECWLSAKPEGASGSQCPLYPAPGYLGADTATATTAATPSPATNGAAAAAPPPTSAPASAATVQTGSADGLLLAALLAVLVVAA